ncbi:MAG: TIGR03619 family F420-dependent LLM class oxidoreductase [Acidimicrobiales bacterium]
MRLGLCLPQLGPGIDAGVVRHFAVDADRLGFDSLWVQEHLLFPLEPRSGYAGIAGRPWPAPYESVLAPLEELAFVAAVTERCTIGTSILVGGYHRPVPLAKQVATLDVLSGGRVALGLGAGWSRDEYEQTGTPFEQRGRWAEELTEALLACWGPDPVQYRGRLFDLPPMLASPKPVRGRVPLVSGFWSEAGLRRTARLFDVWQPAGVPAATAVERIGLINERAREDYGRGPLELSLRVFVAPALPGVSPSPGDGGMRPTWRGGVDELAAQVADAKQAGCDEVVLDTSFATGLPLGSGWTQQPGFLAPLLAVAHG